MLFNKTVRSINKKRIIMTIESVECDSSQSNEIAFATSIEFGILCFLSISMLAHINCNMMIGILVGFIVGYFAEARSKPDKALKRRARPKKPPDKFIQSKMSTRLIVIFGFAFVAILSSRSFNSLILNDDLVPSNQHLWQTKAIKIAVTNDSSNRITSELKAIESVVSSDAIKEAVLQEDARNFALDLAFTLTNKTPPAKSTTTTTSKHGNCFVKTGSNYSNRNIASHSARFKDNIALCSSFSSARDASYVIVGSDINLIVVCYFQTSASSCQVLYSLHFARENLTNYNKDSWQPIA